MRHDLEELSKKAKCISKYRFYSLQEYFFSIYERFLAYDIINDAIKQSKKDNDKITAEYIATHRRELFKNFVPKVSRYIEDMCFPSIGHDSSPLLDKFFNEMPWDDVNKFESEKREAV